MFDHRGKQIYLICGSTDMRKGIDGLSSIVDLRLVCNSFESAMFIFCNVSVKYPGFLDVIQVRDI
ncbi:MAG: IS66 family insertion sequence element accessory protein TnpB [Synergistaceae bacterium]|nr:IS66 family insertion sequence element accessory protein TnpB [Synergistaceae bacterium]